MSNQVKLTFAGDASSLERAFTSVGSSTASFSDKIDRASKETSRGFDRMGTAAGGATTHFRGTADVVDGLGTILGATALGPVAGMAMGFADLADGIGTSLLPGIAKFVTFVKGLTVASVAQTVATAAQTAAQWALNIAMNANPIGLVIAALAALVAAVVLTVKHFDTIKAVAVGAFNAVKNAVGDAVGFILGGLSTLLNKVADVAGHLPFIGDDIKRSLKSAAGAVDEFRQSAHDGFTSAADRMREVVGEANRIEDAIQSVAKLGHSAGVTFGKKTAGFGIAMGRAAGGPVSAGQAYMVGERGPEMFLPSTSGMIAPNSGGGTMIVVNVAGSVQTERDLVQAIQQGAREARRRGFA